MYYCSYRVEQLFFFLCELKGEKKTFLVCVCVPAKKIGFFLFLFLFFTVQFLTWFDPTVNLDRIVCVVFKLDWFRKYNNYVSLLKPKLNVCLFLFLNFGSFFFWFLKKRTNNKKNDFCSHFFLLFWKHKRRLFCSTSKAKFEFFIFLDFF